MHLALTPESPPRILTLDIDSFPYTHGGALERAVAAAVAAVGSGRGELSSVVAPIRSVMGWVACDEGAGKGAVLVEGALADVVVGVDLGRSPPYDVSVTPATWVCRHN